MKLIIISSPEREKNEIRNVNDLFEAGMHCFHLRKPHFSTKEMQQYLGKIDDRFHDRIMIHSHHELCLSFMLRGIHITEKHREKRYWQTLLTRKYLEWRRKNLSVSTGFHAQSDLLNSKTPYSYVFLSPVFDSVSKPGYKSAFSEESLRATLRKSNHKVIALGGVDENKIDTAKQLGFYGVALLGRIWKDDHPVEKFKQIDELCNRSVHTF